MQILHPEKQTIFGVMYFITKTVYVWTIQLTKDSVISWKNDVSFM